MSYGFDVVATPLGAALAVGSDAGLLALHVGSPPEVELERLARVHRIVPRQDPAVSDALASQLEEYFAGARRAFDVRLDWGRAAGFARDALRAVCTIPYAETASYGEVAALALRAARAVGTACRTSPFSIVVPVHRVIRSDGSLGHYGGDPKGKQFLVDLERRGRGGRDG